MKFGMIYELQLPRPWGPGAEKKLFDNVLDQIELADKLGYDSVWEVEHHFLAEYAQSSSPEIFLAAASQRTKNIRIGHGVKLMLPGYNPPARIAEQIATLDIVSGGRVEWGTGESGSATELLGYGIDPTEKRATWLEVVPEVANMMAMENYPGFEGRYFSMPARTVVPKPIQKPHPPLWVACSQPQTVELAARTGIGAMSFGFVGAETTKQWVDTYWETFRREATAIGHAVNPGFTLVIPFAIHEDEKEAVRRGTEGLRFFSWSLNAYYGEDPIRPGTDVWAKWQAYREKAALNGGTDLADSNQMFNFLDEDLRKRACIGTPDQVREILHQYVDAGVEQIVFLQQVGNNTHEEICEGLQLFADELMPEFHALEPERLRKKEAEVAPYVKAALDRKQWRQEVPSSELADVPPLMRMPAVINAPEPSATR